jgi:hypothetical protein
VQLSDATIAMACDETKDFVYKVMTEICSLLIEVCRNTKYEAKLDFAIGILHLH